MTKAMLLKDRKYIEENAGNIPASRMLKLYERYCHGSEMYGLGVEYNNEVFGIFRKHIPLKYCSCQTEHGAINNQYLRFRPHESGAKEIARARGAINFGKTEDVYTFYQNNTKQGFNGGYCFEIAVFNYYGIDGWEQDNLPASEGGDVEINGKQIQLKFVPKKSLATITTTNKLLNRINQLLKECA